MKIIKFYKKFIYSYIENNPLKILYFKYKEKKNKQKK